MGKKSFPGSRDDKHTQPAGYNKKKKQRLGGGGLSLGAFAAAKSKPNVNHAQIREQREFYRNAKKIQKYNKLAKHIGEKKDVQSIGELADFNSLVEARAVASEVASGSVEVVPERHKSSKGQGKKRMTQLQMLREEFERKKKEEECAAREKQLEYQAQQEAREKTQQARRSYQEKMRKKTRSGQPVMKHRMEHLLELLQRDS